MPDLRRLAVLGAAGLLAACGAYSGSPSPGDLAYAVPDPNPVAYTFHDSSAFVVESAMGPLRVTTLQSGTAELDFRTSDAGLRVQLRFPEFEGVFDNPMSGRVTVDQDDMDGVMVVRVDGRGDLTVEEMPEVTDPFRSIAGPDALARPFFPALPGGSAAPGDTWVDTTTIVDESSEMESSSSAITTYTLVGDTVVAGRTLLLIRTEAEVTIEVTGVTGGVEIEQRVSGTSTGVVLWDAAAAVMVERQESARMSGTLDVPGVGAPTMPVRAVSERTISLRD